MTNTLTRSLRRRQRAAEWPFRRGSCGGFGGGCEAELAQERCVAARHQQLHGPPSWGYTETPPRRAPAQAKEAEAAAAPESPTVKLTGAHAHRPGLLVERSTAVAFATRVRSGTEAPRIPWRR